jgi:hypothetical protein
MGRCFVQTIRAELGMIIAFAPLWVPILIGGLWLLLSGGLFGE